MPMGLRKLWKRVTAQKTAVKPFAPEADDAQSEPASPRDHSKEDGAFAPDRPATTNEEVRPLSSAERPVSVENSTAHVAPLKTADQDTASPLELAPQPPSEPVPATSSAAAAPSVKSSSVFLADDKVASPVRCPVSGVLADDVDSAFLARVKADLDLPFSDVLTKVGKEFGDMTATSVRSTKWDKRVQALKAMGAVLKGLDLGSGTAQPSAMKGLRLRDRSSCWRAICLVLHHSLRDKVMPVRLASHDLFCDAFACCVHTIPEEEVRAMAGILLGIILEVLGDSNLRLHESARKCVLLCAEKERIIGFKPVLASLNDRLTAVGKSRERVKVSFGVLDCVSDLLKHSLTENVEEQPTSWTMEDVTPFVVTGMDDALGPRVRSAAVAIAVMLRTSYGGAAMEPVVANFRPAVQAVLREKFADLEGDCESEDGDDAHDGFVAPGVDIMAGLVVCGSAIRPKSTSSSSLPGAVDEEDSMMDDILEETGAVFCHGKTPQSALTSFGSAGYLSACDEAMIMALGQEIECPTAEPMRKRSVRFNLAVESAIEVF